MDEPTPGVPLKRFDRLKLSVLSGKVCPFGSIAKW